MCQWTRAPERFSYADDAPWQELVSEISHQFTLFPGDIVLTGTPKGVGKLEHGDTMVAELDNLIKCEAQVVKTTDKSNG